MGNCGCKRGDACRCSSDHGAGDPQEEKEERGTGANPRGHGRDIKGGKV